MQKDTVLGVALVRVEDAAACPLPPGSRSHPWESRAGRQTLCVLSKQISASRVLPWLSDKLIFLFIQQISQAVSECHLKIMTWGFLGKDCSQTTCSVLQSSEGNFGDLPVSI